MPLPNSSTTDKFDFVIVGGGTAGLVLAARLTENPDVTVCVVEAGASRLDDPLVALPGGVAHMLSKPEYDWNYHTTPQRATGNKVYHLPRGKMLGGSSAINFMAYGRPCKADIDDWSSTLGLPGWSWEELLPFFKKSEKLEVDLSNTAERNSNDGRFDSSFHGTDGPVHTSLTTWNVPVDTKVLAALDQVSGLSRSRDHYSGDHVGFSHGLFTVNRTGRPVRSYSADAYLQPASTRPNLRVLTNALVSKIIIERSIDGALLATGVQIFEGEKPPISLYAQKEVVLSAGTYHTPAILERSGIGHPDILEQAHVSCLVDNRNVGTNLQEHVMSPLIFELADGIMSLDTFAKDSELVEHHQRLYAENHSGAFSGCLSIVGYLPLDPLVSHDTHQEIASQILKQDKPNEQQQIEFQNLQRMAIARRMQGEKAADIQILGTPATFDTKQAYMDSAKLLAGARSGKNASYSLVVSHMYPLSRGSVHIASASYDAMPTINPNFLRDPIDAQILAAGLRFANAVFESYSLQGSVGQRVEPPPEIDLQDDHQACAYVRESIVTYNHAVGTCAMGQVVDERLRLMGVKNLRVVDASVMPTLISSAIMATVYAIAEKAAVMIMEDHSLTV